MKNWLLILLLLPALAEGQIRNLMAKYPIDEPSVMNLNDGIRGKWKFAEDTDKNNFYEIIRESPYALDRYHIKFWNRSGTNATYEANMHFSKIGDVQFLNVPYSEGNHYGFLFLRIVDVSAGFTKMTAAVVADTALWSLDQAAVKQRIAQHINNAAYYRDTVHFYKLR